MASLADVHVAIMRIAISTQPKLLHILRGVVRYYAQEGGFSENEVNCLEMAVDEAAANVIRHTYHNSPTGRMALEVLDFADRLEFVIEDSGPKVRPESVQPRPLDDVRPGGLGTFFIQCFTDLACYDDEFTEGNRLRLVKFKGKKGGT
jgi:anti-sigma regulatory factor (Ser/Thr protein kinase)